ncbi:MAG: hypothetical protein ACOYOA_03165 [Saprospiraceae bacterium]
MKKTSISANSENSISTYRRLRLAIGWLGVLLPIILVSLSLIPAFKTSIQGSISHYYYTNLREIFTGILCAVGLFLIRYNGHTNPNLLKNDRLLTNIAGAMAFGVAFFPTNPIEVTDKIYSLIPSTSPWLGWLHYFFAGTLFLILATISINVFTIGQHRNDDIPISLWNENHIYRGCGYFMLLFILMIPICDFFGLSYTTLVFEGLALIAFGISWLIKGRVMGDKGQIGQSLYREQN